MQENDNPFLKSFADPVAVSRYHQGPPRFTPGFADLHTMTTILLTEHAPEDARILVLGAGGGLELRAMAAARPNWTFEGVDPSAEMLKLARVTVGEMTDRVKFVEGIIDDATPGPFDGAVCLLTLHFLKPEERMRTVGEIHRRLKPGAPFVAAHSSFPQNKDERNTWLSRYENFALASGVDAQMAAQARESVCERLDVLEPSQDEEILRSAGFSKVSLFYAAFTWRGWVAYAPRS